MSCRSLRRGPRDRAHRQRAIRQAVGHAGQRHRNRLRREVTRRGDQGPGPAGGLPPYRWIAVGAADREPLASRRGDGLDCQFGCSWQCPPAGIPGERRHGQSRRRCLGAAGGLGGLACGSGLGHERDRDTRDGQDDHRDHQKAGPGAEPAGLRTFELHVYPAIHAVIRSGGARVLNKVEAELVQPTDPW